MENSLSKVQTEVMYEVLFEGKNYSVIHIENLDMDSSWDVIEDPIEEDDEFDDNIHYVHNQIVDEDIKAKIIEFVIENI